MLTEADMIRIMAEKYSFTESLADAYIDDEFIDDEAHFGMTVMKWLRCKIMIFNF